MRIQIPLKMHKNCYKLYLNCYEIATVAWSWYGPSNKTANTTKWMLKIDQNREKSIFTKVYT